MELDEEYPKKKRNSTARLRKMLAAAPGLNARDIETLAFAMNVMADKAFDLNEIFERILYEPHTLKEIAELLIAFELTTEQLRGFSDDIDGKLYEIADRLKGLKRTNGAKKKTRIKTKI